MKRFFPWLTLVTIIIIVGQFLTLSFEQARIYMHTRTPVSTSTAQGPTQNPPDETFLVVSRVVDGDTVDIIENGAIVRVRLIGINTPETVDPRRIVECFGKEASQKMKELLAGGLVRLENDTSQGMYDKYHRRLAYLHTPDGIFVNLELVKQGYAYEYTYRTPYAYQSDFNVAQDEASLLKRGLWADGACAK